MFNVGDKVRRKIGYLTYCGWSHESDVQVVTAVLDRGDTIQMEDIEGDWDSDKFDLVEAAPPNLNDLLPLIQQWGRDRGILDNSTPLGQSRKTVEEVRELVEEASALNVLSGLPGEDTTEVLDRLADAIGDVFVTLVMVAGCAKLDINACVAQAYEEIKNRKGKMNDKGVWVKEEEQV